MREMPLKLRAFLDTAQGLEPGTVFRIHWPGRRTPEEAGFALCVKREGNSIEELWSTADGAWQTPSVQSVSEVSALGWADDIWCEMVEPDEGARLLALLALNEELFAQEVMK